MSAARHIGDFATTVSHELAAAGLIPDTARFDYVTARLVHFGEIEYDRLLKSIASDLVRKRNVAIRLLGWGHVMTEFAVAHLAPSEKPDPAVLSLGALANLIVSSYDGLLDSGEPAERILPRSRLTVISDPAEAGDAFVMQLVELYLTSVSCLPHPHAQLDKTLRCAIVRMYDAELATIRPCGFSPAIWRRKSALPLVIMGLPVWMTVPSFDPVAYGEHLNWLYRLGRFFGWIDDIADLDDDRAAGRLNYFSAGIDPSMPGRIARQGGRILTSWDTRAPAGRYGRTLRQTFLAITWSWLGTYKTVTLNR